MEGGARWRVEPRHARRTTVWHGYTRRATTPGGLTWAGALLRAGLKAWKMGRLQEIPKRIKLGYKDELGQNEELKRKAWRNGF
jgi:hypothetical protein